MPEILCKTDDVNTELPSEETGASTSDYPFVVNATEDNTYLLQIQTARVVRGYLSGVIDSVELQSWSFEGLSGQIDPPEIITVAAAKLIAAQLYFNHIARTSITIDELSFAQIKYNQAMEILNKIIAGEIVLETEAPVVVVTEHLSLLDFHPIDDTDRAFTMGMEL